MNDSNVEECPVWAELAACCRRYYRARMAFFAEGVDRVSLIRKAMPTADRFIAVLEGKGLSQSENMELFDVWIDFVRADAEFHAIRDIILSLPREWVLNRIEEAVEPHLRDYEDYCRYLDLYESLDASLTAKLALRACTHSDVEVQEMGKRTLDKLNR
ncbi:MAG: hypothetical protein WBQ66_19585 [Blastocatellia bacterium]